MVAYRFEDSRAGECVARHLSSYRGILQVDGYAAYSKLVRSDGGNDGVTLASCWSHSRRKFYELHAAGKLKGRNGDGRADGEALADRGDRARASPEARVAARRRSSAAVVAELSSSLWQKTLPRVSGK